MCTCCFYIAVFILLFYVYMLFLYCCLYIVVLCVYVVFILLLLYSFFYVQCTNEQHQGNFLYVQSYLANKRILILILILTWKVMVDSEAQLKEMGHQRGATRSPDQDGSE